MNNKRLEKTIVAGVAEQLARDGLAMNAAPRAASEELPRTNPDDFNCLPCPMVPTKKQAGSRS